MRGGDSLMFWISRLNGVIWNIRHSSNCIRQPTVRCPSSVFFGNRFRSADCQKIQLPLGGSQGEETIHFYHSTNGSVPSGFGRLIAAPTGRVQNCRLQRKDVCRHLYVFPSGRRHDDCRSKQFVNNVSSVATLATCWHEVPLPPLEGEVPNEREAEGLSVN